MRKLMARKNPIFILDILEKLYEWRRPKTEAKYPYNRETDTVHLPSGIVAELKEFLATGKKSKAIKRIEELTGVSLRISKDFVDDLLK